MNQKIAFFISLCFASFLFVFLYGLHFLDPTQTQWLLSGDSQIFFYGQSFFSHEPWTHPLGKVVSYSFPESSSIVYTDSIPYLALLSKVFFQNVVLQYFGVWVLLCFLLQSAISFLIINEATESPMTGILGSLFFLTLPTFLSRQFLDTKHYSLLGQFIILLALYLLSHKERKTRPIFWFLLFALSLGIHLYLSFAVGVFFLLSFTPDQIKALMKKPWTYLSLLFLAFLSYELGYFQIPLGNATAGGFGLFSMSLSSPLDSMGRSFFLKALPHADECHEGYQYLGFGLICFIAYSLIQRKRRESFKSLLTPLFDHWIILFALLLLIVSFQWSILQFKLWEWFTLPISALLFCWIRIKKDKASLKKSLFEFLLVILWVFVAGKIFRATGRFFWIFDYLILFYLFKAQPKKSLLLLFTVLQLMDVSPFLLEIRKQNQELFQKQPVLPFSGLNQLESEFDHITLVGGYMIPPSSWYHFALTHHKTMGPLPVARASSSFRNLEKKSIREDLLNLNFKNRVLYVVGEEELRQKIESACKEKPELCKNLVHQNENDGDYYLNRSNVTKASDPINKNDSSTKHSP